MSSWPITISLPQGLTMGGVTTWAVNLARALATTQRETRLVVHQPATEGFQELDPVKSGSHANLRVIRAPSLTDPSAWNHCVRIYRDLLPTVLSPNLLAESYAVAAALATVHPERLRVVGWNHLDNPYDYEHLAYYEPIIHRFVAVSRHCATELSRRIPTRAKSIEHLPYGVFVPAEQPRPPLASRPIRLIYAGRIQQTVKRVFDCVSLAELLDRRGIRFELRLVGDGPQSAELRRRFDAVTRNLTNPRNQVWLEPAVPHDQMWTTWSWADAALLTSAREGFSVSMVESMACGCVPVVSRVASGVSDVVQEGRTGLMFPLGDIEALADRIERLTGDAPNTRRMSRAARRAASEHSGYERFFQRVLQILDIAADEHERPWPPTRPLHMSARDSWSGATVPHDAADRLRRLLKHLARTEGGPIAVYGAGNHTRALASVWAASPVEIVAVIDDDYNLNGRRLWGWPIVGPQAAAETGATSVVISSWMHESEIWQQQAGRLEAAGLRVFRLYAETPEPSTLQLA